MSKENISILVVGKPNSGKSGFFGQLYNRLEYAEEGNFAKLLKTPENKIALDKVTSRYAEGKALEHTPVGDYDKIELSIHADQKSLKLIYPDYGGEQINHLVENRRLGNNWYSAIQNSNEWILFIRLSDLNKSYDPIQKFTKIVQSGEQKSKDEIEEKLPSDQAYYIELIQMLLFYKEIGFTSQISNLELIVTLTCWDEIENKEEKKPNELLKEHLPLFYEFLIQNWVKTSLKVIGISSQGRSLDKNNGDEEYLFEEEGFIINSNGEKNNDLTSILKIVLDEN
ncbi:hypothetical protein [Dokdonia sp.]|uniref:TRAFAC clade GTPase domain-containing protein n=1 Tax=Dokdonia sp. TaxID=2024995 RepID=UPI003266D571